MLKIKNVQLKNNVGLAPLAGVSDIAFREICKTFGASITFTEMVSAKGLHYKSKKTNELLSVSPLEDIVGAQLFGSDANIIASIIPQIENDFSLIDINMGCPAPKVTKNGEGSALLKKENFKLAQEVLTKAVKATQLPVTIKMRAGYSQDTAEDFAKMAEDCGVSAISIHPRLATQLYRGKADWSITAKVKHAVKIPVIARGDIFSVADYQNCIEQTGADGAYIARGSFGNPFIFKEINDKNYHVTKHELCETMLKHIDLSNKYMGARYTVVNMRKHILWYINNNKQFFDTASIKNIRNVIHTVSSIEILNELVMRLK